MSYATVPQFKQWLGIDDTVDDAELQSVLDAATRSIDYKCSRSFTLQTAATKYFYPSTSSTVDVPDLISVTSIKLDISGNRTYGYTMLTSEYELLPYADDVGVPSVRYQQIRVWPFSTHAFAPGQLIQIVGNFGYVVGGSAPADVIQACLILGARFWKRRETPLGLLETTMGVASLAKEDLDVKRLLMPYARNYDWVMV